MAQPKKSVVRFHSFAFVRWGSLWTEELIALLLVVFIFVTPASAATRLQERGLYMRDNTPGAVTDYTVSFKYATPESVGSIDMLFCIDPIPYMPCEVPPGLDISQATLSDQTGSGGYSISTKTSNRIVLSRTPGIPVTGVMSTYTLSGIKNPTDEDRAFSIRLKTLASTDGSGDQIDFGSVRGQAQPGVVLETQVPPMLIFCVAEEVDDNCRQTNDNYYTDMGQLSKDSTLMAQSEMMAATNATNGFVITAVGTPLAAGTSVIDGLPSPTESIQGVDQFGINLVENNAPAIGGNSSTGLWMNGAPTADYAMPNKYKYVSGDVVATSPSVNMFQKFTVSYVVNSSAQLKPGVYTTTITYIASGRF